MIKHTILTSDEAIQKYEDNTCDILTGKERVLMREYIGLISSVEYTIKQHLPNLLNPNSHAQTDEWRQVQELANKLALNHANQSDLARIAEIEKQLTDMGVIDGKCT